MLISFAVLAATIAAPGPPPLPAPAHFVRVVDNAWFPLRPGTTYVYSGQKDGRTGRDVVRVTHRTRLIEGVHATVVHDRTYLHGRLAERTSDYYAQDRAGNVWYLGEDTAELDAGGRVTSTEGSWRAGVDGARAGIYMPGDPRVGQAGWQEFYRGHAEDRFKVLRRRGGVLVTQETSPLEPGVLDHKHYRRGVGTALEVTVKGGSERWVLRRR